MSLEVRDLVVGFGRTTVLRSVSVSLPSSGIVGLIGANGAGKSTLLDALAGFIRIRHGSISWNGHPLSRRKRSRTCVRLHQVDIVPEVRGGELIALATRPLLFSSYWWKSAAIEEATEHGARRVELFAERSGDLLLSERPLRSMSGGQRRVIGTLAVLETQKPVVLLDEPFSGVSESSARYVVAHLRAAAASRLVVIAEHDLSILQDLVEMLVIMRGGVVVDQMPVPHDRSMLLRHFA